MSQIIVKNLSKRFGNFTAVSDLSFAVDENRVVGFLGPNGAGKTTTMRMLVGLSKPTSGSIEIAGQNVLFGDSSANKYFGYLPEQPAFYAWMTGYEYLKFVAESFGMKKDEYSSKIEKLLVTVGLTAAKNKKIGAYSNGMRQRLGIAQAVINDPKVLIMDEPVSALDPIGRKETLQVIEKLKKNMTILFSTHILSDVDKICDDVIIIDKGKLLAFSSLSELKEKHATQILQIEFQSDPEKLVKDLEKEDWVAKVEKAGNNLSLVLKDDEVIQNNLPMKYFSSKGIGIISYTLNLPQVEDLFEELVREDK